ncbi:MAG: hypothetical protein PF484_12170 [Bacteroidales bacterium]|jgi:hypothetical protein|nr:hypothetical protein [Bacteroidales bacterium]
MNIQTSKIELVKLILNIDNNDFIRRVTDFIKNEKADFWNELSQTEQIEIKKGIEELEKGERISFDEVLKKIS